MKILSAEKVGDKISPSGEARAAQYEITFTGAHELPIEDILQQKTMTMVFEGKDGTKEKDIRPDIYKLYRAKKKDTLICVLAAGNQNLRADRFIAAAADFAKIDLKGKELTITRTKIYNAIPKETENG